MTVRTRILAALAATAALAAAGCATQDGTTLTSSVTPSPAKPAMAAKVDPACVTLASQIDTLRKEGAVERLEKASTGKGKSVSVQRTSLAKQAELNKANAEFQAKCAPPIQAAAAAQAAAPAPVPAGAQVPPVAAAAVNKATDTAAAKATDAVAAKAAGAATAAAVKAANN